MAWWLPALAVVAVGLLAWGVLHAGAAVSTGSAASAGDSTARGRTSEPESGRATTSTDRSSASDLPSGAEAPPAELDFVNLGPGDIADQPELEGLVGHHLFIDGPSELVRIDVDSGQVDHFDALEPAESLIGHYRDHLLITNAGRVMAAPGDRPDGTRVPVVDVGKAQIVEASVIGPTLTLVAIFPERQVGRHQRVMVDLDDTELVDVADAWHTGDLFWVSGGGLFQRVDGVYDHVADGYPIVVGERFVLVHECDAPTTCTERWVDRHDDAEVDRHVPDADFMWNVRGIDSIGRLVAVDGDQGSRYFDTERGWFLPTELDRPFDGYGEMGTLTVDGGALLVTDQAPDLVLYHLDSPDRAFRLSIDGVKVHKQANLVAVPKTNRWARTES